MSPPRLALGEDNQPNCIAVRTYRHPYSRRASPESCNAVARRNGVSIIYSRRACCMITAADYPVPSTNSGPAPCHHREGIGRSTSPMADTPRACPHHRRIAVARAQIRIARSEP